MLMIAFLHKYKMYVFYIGQEMIAVNNVFQPTGLTKLRLPNMTWS